MAVQFDIKILNAVLTLGLMNIFYYPISTVSDIYYLHYIHVVYYNEIRCDIL